MKKIIYIMTLVLLASSCDKIKEKDLPDAARSFLSTHFKDIPFSHGEKDKDDGTTTYEVTLTNGTEIEFNESGEWTSVDCKFSFVPTAIIPTTISTYLTTEYPGSNATKIEKEMGGYEVTINTVTGELIFDTNGKFIRINPS